MQPVWVPSLSGELRSHMLCGVAKKKKKKDSGEDENIFLNNVLFF